MDSLVGDLVPVGLDDGFIDLKAILGRFVATSMLISMWNPAYDKGLGDRNGDNGTCIAQLLYLSSRRWTLRIPVHSIL